MLLTRAARHRWLAPARVRGQAQPQPPPQPAVGTALAVTAAHATVGACWLAAMRQVVPAAGNHNHTQSHRSHCHTLAVRAGSCSHKQN